METSNGFQLTFTMIRTPCGPYHHPLRDDAPQIEIVSPNSQNGVYMENLNCLWKITAAENQVIRIDFEKLDIEETSDGLCSKDYLEIFDDEV